METKHRPFLTAAVLAGVLVVAGCGGGGGSKKAGPLPPSAVAVVGDRTISTADLDSLLAGVKRRDVARATAFPKKGTAAYRTLRRKALQTLVREAEFDQKRADLGLQPVTKHDVDVELAKDKLKLFGPTKTQSLYRNEIAREGVTEADLRADLQARLVEDRVYQKVVSSITISQKEIQDFYDKNKTQYGHPATREIRHILVASKPLADSIEEKIRSGAKFAALAKKYSKDLGTAGNGGEVTISQGHTLPGLDTVAFKLKLNEVSSPFATSYGWHIVEAIGPVVQATFTPLAQKEREIRAQILRLKKDRSWAKFLADMRKEFASTTRYKPGFGPASSATS
jgi:foldase protein PrsA